MRARLHDRAARRAQERTRTALLVHPLLPLVIDPAWYAARYRDVFWAGVDATEHLLGPGLAEGRDPGPFVDLAFVRTQRSGPPVDSATLLLELLDRGLDAGWRPSPYVDPAWYADRYAPTDPTIPSDPVGALRHLIEVGVPAGRAPGPFLALDGYASRIPDVASGGIDPFTYFTALGQHLGRFPHPAWDETGYLDANEYVRFALGMGKYLHGFAHFCAVGHAEVARGALLLPVRLGERDEEFSEVRYLAANPDVAQMIAEGRVTDGATHFFAVGHREVLAGNRPLAPVSAVAHLLPDGGPVVRRSAERGRSLMALVHYDVDGVIDPHVLAAIEAYRQAEVDVHLVSSGVDEASRTALRERGVPVHLRSSNDDLRDFGAWALLLAHVGAEELERYGRVILANDSAYFPVLDPQPFLAAMHDAPHDVWSATDSFSGGRYHLQSYFLALGPRAVRLLVPELAARAAAHSHPTKLGLIQRFEIGLSQFAAAHGLTLGAFCSVADLVDPAASMSPPDPRPLSHLTVTVTNLTHHYWRDTLRRGLPFLKVELLRDNPLGVDLTDWSAALQGGTCTTPLIEAHLARVNR
jgi:hypothetical protein